MKKTKTWLSKLFMSKKKKQHGFNDMASSTQPIKYIFDIEVIDSDENGAPLTERQYGIIAESADMLHALYATCDQKINILRQTPVGAAQVDKAEPQADPANLTVEHLANPVPVTNVTHAPQVQTEQPRYITVSGIKMRITGDKIAQKQWVRASADEAACIRIVSDSTNRIFNLDGKHIEIEKWVNIEEADNTILNDAL